MSNNKQPIPEIFTDTQIYVSGRINKGLREYFSCKIRAQAAANKIRSYVYECFDAKKKHIGYCVTK